MLTSLEIPLDIDMTGLARPMGILVPVTFASGLWSFCEARAPGAGVAMSPERVARYLLAGLVRALRRQKGPELPPQGLAFRLALGNLVLELVGTVERAPAGLELRLDACVPQRQHA